MLLSSPEMTSTLVVFLFKSFSVFQQKQVFPVQHVIIGVDLFGNLKMASLLAEQSSQKNCRMLNFLQIKMFSNVLHFLKTLYYLLFKF
jgi:hypothetical protein